MDQNTLKVDSNEYYISQKEDAGTELGAWADQMIEALKKFVNNAPLDFKIVDIGCYKGVGLKYLRSLGYQNIFGIDLVKDNIQAILSNDINGLALDMHDMSLIKDKYFDLSFTHHVIEHSIDPIKVLKEIIRISKNGLVVFPLAEHDSKIRVAPPHYYSFFTSQDVLDVIEAAGLPAKYSITNTKRLGEEVWLEFYE